MKQLFILLFILALATGARGQDKYKIIKDIPYVSAGDTSTYRKERCKLDIYYPATKKDYKTIIWFHGGGLEGGNKEFRDELLNAGIAIVSPNYRLYPYCKNPQYTQDAAAAVAWVFHHIEEYGGDPLQIYMGGHSAGGYLTLMLALDKAYLNSENIDADAVKGYFSVSGQTATHYTIRKERGLSFSSPFVDRYAPLNNVRKLSTRLVLITGDRHLEQMARYEENLYLKAVLEGIGDKEIPLHELSGFDHGGVLRPAGLLIKEYLMKL